ncbi:MAG: DEAD/DEAH box helicase [Nocardioidaceae bacterium]
MAPRRSTLPTPTSFSELGLPDALVETLEDLGISTPFPIQAATLPDALSGRDVLGRGRTGSGKTYAFLLPLLSRLASRPVAPRATRPRALVLCPTRELAGQIATAAAPLAEALGLRIATVFGGVGIRPQADKLRKGVDLLVACPGRLEDLVGQGFARLDDIEVTVLDEADHMADLGFLPGVKRLLDRTPQNGQRLLFSATLDAGVDVLVKKYLTNPVTHSVDTAQSPVATMTHHVLHIAKESRLPVLADLTAAPGRTVVFTRTKHGARNLARQLNAQGVPAVELHGNLSQNARTRNLAAFSDGTATTLVATDIAARGIHVDDVNLVVHADPPVEHKAYLHRSGRTARAGNDGTVVTLMLDAQVSDVRDLTRKAGIKPTITRVTVGDPLLTTIAPGERTFVDPAKAAPAPPADGRSGGNGNGNGGRSRRRGGGGRNGGGNGGSSNGGGAGGGRRRGDGGATGSSSSGGSRSGAPRSGGSRGSASTSGSGSSSRGHSAASFSSRTRGR